MENEEQINNIPPIPDGSIPNIMFDPNFVRKPLDPPAGLIFDFDVKYTKQISKE